MLEWGGRCNFDDLRSCHSMLRASTRYRCEINKRPSAASPRLAPLAPKFNVEGRGDLECRPREIKKRSSLLRRMAATRVNIECGGAGGTHYKTHWTSDGRLFISHRYKVKARRT